MVTSGIKWFSPTTFKDPHIELGTSVELDSWEILQLKTVHNTPYMKVLYNVLKPLRRLLIFQASAIS